MHAREHGADRGERRADEEHAVDAQRPDKCSANGGADCEAEAAATANARLSGKTDGLKRMNLHLNAWWAQAHRETPHIARNLGRSVKSETTSRTMACATGIVPPQMPQKPRAM